MQMAHAHIGKVLQRRAEWQAGLVRVTAHRRIRILPPNGALKIFERLRVQGVAFADPDLAAAIERLRSHAQGSLRQILLSAQELHGNWLTANFMISVAVKDNELVVVVSE